MTPTAVHSQSIIDIPGGIAVSTDKSTYETGDVIEISGRVSQYYSGIQVSIVVLSPGQLARVAVDQIPVASDGTFSTGFVAGGTMVTSGIYTITAQYGGPTIHTDTTFEYTSTFMPPEPPVDTPILVIDPSVGDTTVTFEGTDDVIGYEITGGTLLSIVPNPPKILTVNIDAPEDGSITLTIPRTILESKNTDGTDDDIFILVDDEEIEYIEETTDEDRTVTIEFMAGNERIDIIGTWVIPEFGTIAIIIMAIAITSIILVTARTRPGIALIRTS